MTANPVPKPPNPRWTGCSRLLAAAAAAALACAAAAGPYREGAPLTAKEQAQGYRDGVVLAKPRPVMLPAIDGVERGEGLTPRAEFARFGHVRVLELAAGDTVEAALARLRATGRYEYVEPNYIRRATAMPDDPQFVNQWALNNTGGNAGGGGIPGADIHAEAGWGTLSSAAGVVVGILDSGAMLTHEDLKPNLWVNPSPYTTASYATQDASGNSEMLQETDDLNGLNAVAKTGQPQDDLGHGSHVSGIVGAVGNNGVGVCGVAWGVQLMELKFLDSSGAGTTTAELPCIEYAMDHGVSVVNGSFGSQGFSQAEMDAIQAAGKKGVIFVLGAGNSAENVDISNFFPADYPLDNIISVGATDSRDLPTYFTNYGSGSVELFAPGENILSTYNSSASSYAYLSGTSMATPFVTGAVALLRAKYPLDTYRQTINRVLNGAQALPSLAGKAQTGGRLNLSASLAGAVNTPPNCLFANRTVLVGTNPYTRSSNADSPMALEPGTPAIAGATGLGHSLWWQWTAPEDASVEIDTSGTNGGSLFTGGSSYATALGVYTGSSLGALTTVAQGATSGQEPLEGSPGTMVPYSKVSFEATAGTTYVINVEGQQGASGQTVLAVSTDPLYDSIGTPRVLSGASLSIRDANAHASLQSAEPRILGNPGGHSLWYTWTAPFSGTAQVSGYSYDFNPEVAVYTGASFPNLAQVAAAASSGVSGTTTAASQCLCTFTAAAGTAYLIKVDGVSANDVGEFTLSIADSTWQATTSDAVTCSPSVGADGTVYVGSNDEKFYAISANGTVKWSYQAGGVFDTSSAAVGPDGTAYAGCTDGNVYAIGANGVLKWTYPVPVPTGTGLDNGLDSSPALSPDGTLYIHADDGNLYALNTSNGSVKWKYPVPGFSYAAPTIAADGTVYVGTDGGQLYAVSAAGTQKWVFNAPVAGESIYTAAAIDAQGDLYFGTLAGNFYSVGPGGTLRWAYAVGNAVTSAPALANGRVFFGGYDARLYALTTAGALAWTCPLGAQVRASAPAVDANGVVYVGCYDHNVYAVGSGGTVARVYATGDIIRSSPAIAGNTMYFASEDHKVYAFAIGDGPAQADWPMYQFNGQRIGTPVANSLAITAQPYSQAVETGSPFSLNVGATGPGTLAYQWYLNGSAIAGATHATYLVAAASTADSGTYTVTVTSGASAVTSAPAVVTVGTNLGRIVNLSARADVGTGGNILIAGFVLSGSGTKPVVLRGVGPTLGAAPYNVSGVLPQPQLTLVNTGTGATVATDTAWGGGAALAAAFSQVGAFALPPGSADAAVEETLAAGSYTSEIAGVAATTGVALAEIYDADPGSASSSLVNLSARANVGTGANILIAGFVIEGSQPATVVLRGVGPALGTLFSVPGALAQPQINLFNSAGIVIKSNSGWGNDPALSTAFAQVGAFALPPGSADAAMLATLPAGPYTLQLSGLNGTTGVALAEIYLVP